MPQAPSSACSSAVIFSLLSVYWNARWTTQRMQWCSVVSVLNAEHVHTPELELCFIYIFTGSLGAACKEPRAPLGCLPADSVSETSWGLTGTAGVGVQQRRTLQACVDRSGWITQHRGHKRNFLKLFLFIHFFFYRWLLVYWLFSLLTAWYLCILNSKYPARAGPPISGLHMATEP